MIFESYATFNFFLLFGGKIDEFAASVCCITLVPLIYGPPTFLWKSSTLMIISIKGIRQVERTEAVEVPNPTRTRGFRSEDALQVRDNAKVLCGGGLSPPPSSSPEGHSEKGGGDVFNLILSRIFFVPRRISSVAQLSILSGWSMFYVTIDAIGHDSNARLVLYRWSVIRDEMCDVWSKCDVILWSVTLHLKKQWISSTERPVVRWIWQNTMPDRSIFSVWYCSASVFTPNFYEFSCRKDVWNRNEINVDDQAAFMVCQPSEEY